MKRTGQIMGQVVAMVAAIIIFGLVLLYGYKAIKNIEHTRQQVEIIEFSESLKSAVKRIALDFGSVKRTDLKVPSQYQEVCFADLDILRNRGRLDELRKKSALIANIVESNSDPKTGQNVFTIPLSETPIKVEAIEVNGTRPCPNGGKDKGSGFICIPTPSGRLSLRLEGLGDKTWVCEWK